MPFNFTKWNTRITRDLRDRRARFDSQWKKSQLLIENAKGYQLRGNLVREYADILFSRVVVKHPTVKFTPDDTAFIDEARNESIVANAITRLINLKSVLREATITSVPAIGWIYCGHSVAEFGVDPKFHPGISSNAQDMNIIDEEDEWEQVPEVPSDIDMENISIFDPAEMSKVEAALQGEEKPSPVFQVIGDKYPYAESVDPLHVVTPRKLKKWGDAEYVARLRVVSKDELETISDISFEKNERIENYTISTQYKDLFPDFDFDFVEHAFLIVECFVFRDRNDQRYNDWYASWIFEHPKKVLRDMPNPLGGMCQLTPVHGKDVGEFLTNSMIDDLVFSAKTYSLLLQSIERDARKSMATKTLVDDRAGTMDAKQDKNLSNPYYDGTVRVGNVDGVKEMRMELDHNKLQVANYVRKIAQRGTATSDLDAGQPIKKISARQTEELVQSTNDVLESIRTSVADAAGVVIQKLMFIMRLFHGEKKEYAFGNKTAVWNPATRDMDTSLVYAVTVEDLGPDPSETERMLFTQFVRVLSSFEALQMKFDLTYIADEGARLYKIDKAAVIRGATGLEGPVIPEMADVPLRERIAGGHMPGDQGMGPGLAQSKAGMRNAI